MKLLFITLISATFFALAGMADGVTQSLWFHYDSVKKRIPAANNEQYWNPTVSWVNKYIDYEGGDKRPRYFGSTTFLVFLTDAYHLFRFLYDLFFALGWLVFMICFLVLWSQMRIWSIPYTLCVWYVGKAIGFHIIYTFVF